MKTAKYSVLVLGFSAVAILFVCGCTTQQSGGGRSDFEQEIQKKIDSGEMQGIQDLQVTYPDGTTHKFNSK